MQIEIRTIQIALAGICLALAALIAGEVAFSTPDRAPSSADMAPPLAMPAIAPPVRNLDGVVAAILDRPLFTRGRRPPAPPDVLAAAAKKVPVLQARLAGMMIEPKASEALFAREGGKPFAVKLHQDIDGWTVTAIEADRVVLTSAFGERILKPTAAPRPGTGPATRGQPAAGRPPAVARQAAENPTPAVATAAAGGEQAAAAAKARTGTPGAPPPAGTKALQ